MDTCTDYRSVENQNTPQENVPVFIADVSQTHQKKQLHPCTSSLISSIRNKISFCEQPKINNNFVIVITSQLHSKEVLLSVWPHSSFKTWSICLLTCLRCSN